MTPPSAQPTLAADPPKLQGGQITALMLALLAAVFAFQLNASMLSPALVVMEQELSATSAQIGLTQTAFFTAAALFSLFLPRWADLIGRRKVLVGMMAVLFLGCIVAALAPNVTVLFIGRVIQGIAGPTVPMCLIMLRVQVPNDKQYALLMGIITSINGGIGGVDALAGGWLADNLGFRSIFWVMSVVAIIALLAVQFGTRESTAVEVHPMDWKGVLPIVIALASALIAFNEAGKLAAANWLLVIGLLVLAVVAFIVFWKIESTVKHPLVSTYYMKQRRTWALLITTLLTMTGVFAVMNGLIPNLGQNVDVGAGISADTVSWWTLTPYALAGLVMGPIAGTLAGKFGYKLVLQVGLIGTAIGLGFAIFVVGNPGPISLLLISLFVGVTYAGISNIMLNGMGIVLSPADNPGYLPGMNAAAFNLGAGLSFAILFAVFTFFADTDAALGFRAGMGTGAVILLLAFLTSFLIPRPESLSDAVGEEAATIEN
ncbi:Antiseptic resistance protein [Corynebacterium occultum]|uniref:Antiseptic resistance protein n=1 Tax=Corynebacterium occultum TaxID=2675219 RepID=A0A6B8VKZ7_9CORY|nr:Antiseptic resistance protein [Corynebacterium occultum]